MQDGARPTEKWPLQTNALPCSTPRYIPSSSKRKPKNKTYGIFPEAARFNSSCSPNVSIAWNRKLGVIRLFTIRDIEKNEELCFAYDGIPLLGTRQERWAATQDKYNFRCECARCEISASMLEESDKRRTELQMRQKGSKFIFTDPIAGLRLVSHIRPQELGELLTVSTASRSIWTVGAGSRQRSGGAIEGGDRGGSGMDRIALYSG